MAVYDFLEGTAPLLISCPHVGTAVPEEIAGRMTSEGRSVADTDWNVHRLYDFAAELGVSLLTPRYARYVIDLNRSPEGQALYPGASNTELCPTTTFQHRPIYRDGEVPDEAEIAERRRLYWQPYHDKIAATLATLKGLHGRVLLWDGHSIQSQVPRFFEGSLPDLNIGTGGGTAADPALTGKIAEVAKKSPYSHVVDGRFKGGYITRNYGKPAEGIHAVQLELSQITYMYEGAPFGFREELADQVRPVIRAMVEAALGWVRNT